jgi:polyhydroxybutyrate depolymerase
MLLRVRHGPWRSSPPARCAAAMPILAVLVGAGNPTQAPPYPAGLSEHAIRIDGAERRFRVHVPATDAPPRALVVVLHGGGGEGLGVADLGAHALSVFRTVADRENFVVAYPAGLPSRDAKARVGWVDCRSDNHVASDADDARFLATLIDTIDAAFGLTASQTFIAGGSNGAQMTHALAFLHPERLGGVATFAGSLPAQPLPGRCTEGPGQPVPILLLHGTGDLQMPWDGGCVANLGGACQRGTVLSATATRDRWLAINGLTGVVPRVTVVDPRADDAGPASRWDYEGPAPVQWWQLDGAGHTVASQTVISAPNPYTGSQSHDLEFAEVAWSFFRGLLPR